MMEVDPLPSGAVYPSILEVKAYFHMLDEYLIRHKFQFNATTKLRVTPRYFAVRGVAPVANASREAV